MYGILAGFIISVAGNLLGIYVRMNYHSYLYIWIIVTLLVLLNISHNCFSIVGGMVALLNLIFGWPNIDVSGWLALVALLHFAEAVLIFFDGYTQAKPVFVRHRGTVVGAFHIQKYWPIPIALLTLSIMLKSDMPADVININTPDWWPLMKQPIVSDNQSLLFGILSLPAALGYSEIIISERPRSKVRKTGIYFMLYSVVLLILAIASTRIYAIKYAAAVFALVVYEIIIIIQRINENKKEAFYSVQKQGVMVLDTIENGPAHLMGIRSGDIILRVNNKDVMTQQGIENILNDFPGYVWVDVLRDNKNYTFEYSNYTDKINDLKIITVPRDGNASNILEMSHNMGPSGLLFKKKWWN